MAKARRKLRVLELVHESLVPPDTLEGLSAAKAREVRTEFQVKRALEKLGHEVMPLGLYHDLTPLREAIEEWKPHIVFNLLEEFGGQVRFDAHVVGYLELEGVPYTGCNPRGLVLARDKALSKKVLAYHRIKVPSFAVFPRGRKLRPNRTLRNLQFPVIVKSLVAEGSEGISQASVVYSDEALRERVDFVHRTVRTDAVAEQYIEGRELYVGVIGNYRSKVLPTWELFLDGLPADAPRIATRKVKWSEAYQTKHNILIGPAEPDIEPAIEATIQRVARRIVKLLNIDGYVRIDFRLTPEGELYFLEANPNPDVEPDAEFASSAEAIGMSYGELIQKLLSLGLRRG